VNQPAVDPARGFLEVSSWRDHYSTEELFASYESWARGRNERYPADRYALGKFMAGMFSPYRPRVTLPGSGTNRPPSYRLGTLENARAAFAAKHGIGSAWPSDTADEVDTAI
jgi:hypothetical protein